MCWEGSRCLSGFHVLVPTRDDICSGSISANHLISRQRTKLRFLRWRQGGVLEAGLVDLAEDPQGEPGLHVHCSHAVQTGCRILVTY